MMKAACSNAFVPYSHIDPTSKVRIIMHIITILTPPFMCPMPVIPCLAAHAVLWCKAPVQGCLRWPS